MLKIVFWNWLAESFGQTFCGFLFCTFDIALTNGVGRELRKQNTVEKHMAVMNFLFVGAKVAQ